LRLPVDPKRENKNATKTGSMRPFVRFTTLVLAILFLTGAGFAWFDVLSHENIFANPELKIAGGWLMTGLMLLVLAIRGCRRSREQITTTRTKPQKQSPR
jgi:hypothetical protein